MHVLPSIPNTPGLTAGWCGGLWWLDRDPAPFGFGLRVASFVSTDRLDEHGVVWRCFWIVMLTGKAL